MSSEPKLSDARQIVQAMLVDAMDCAASDVHIEPVIGGNYELRYRIDGLLQPVGMYDNATGRSVVGRLMVLAGLLTYRLDIPQEGRMALHRGEDSSSMDLRLAVMPTAHGLRAAVRLPAELSQACSLDTLSLPEPVLSGLRQFAGTDQGMMIVTGPAGSGKTTTIYALLNHIAQAFPGLSIIALEDPVERHLRGVTQIEVQSFGELTYAKALRSILRQDPQVLMLGEIRDAETASLAVQAALSGHRLICTLHAGTPGGAIARLLDMGVEPYQITSSLFAVIAQRLLRRRNPGGQGYRGRIPVAEIAFLDEPLRDAIHARADSAAMANASHLNRAANTMRQAANELIARGVTDAAEVQRVLGER